MRPAYDAFSSPTSNTTRFSFGSSNAVRRPPTLDWFVSASELTIVHSMIFSGYANSNEMLSVLTVTTCVAVMDTLPCSGGQKLALRGKSLVQEIGITHHFVRQPRLTYRRWTKTRD